MGQLHLGDIIAGELRLDCTPRQGVACWDPRIKLALLVIAIALNIWLAIPWLSGSVLIIGLGLLLWSRPSGRQVSLFLIAPLWATFIMVVGFSLGFGHILLFAWGQFTFTRDGLLLGGYAALRGYCDIIWLALTFVTTPFPRVLTALRWYRVPAILVDTLAMMYRYSFELYYEFARMRLAAQSRGGRGDYQRDMHSLARIAAQIFLRAYDRSERIYWAMFARGGD